MISIQIQIHSKSKPGTTFPNDINDEAEQDDTDENRENDPDPVSCRAILRIPVLVIPFLLQRA